MFVEYILQIIDKTKELAIAHKKATVTLLVVGICLLTITSVLSNWLVVYISIDKPNNTTITKSYIRQDVNENEAQIHNGINFLPKNTTHITIESASHMRTISPIELHWYGFSYKKITLNRDNNAVKAAFRTTLDNPCTAYSRMIDQLLQYSCSKPQTLVKYNAPEKGLWGIETIASSIYYPFDTPMQYHNGIIGITETADHQTRVAAVNGSGDVKFYNMPNDYHEEGYSDVQIYTDTYNPDNLHFALVTRKGDIFLATPKNSDSSEIEYKKIPAPQDYIPESQNTLCTLDQGGAICYQGVAPYTGETPPSADKIEPKIIKVNFNDNTPAIIKIRDTQPSDFTLQTIARTQDGKLYGLSDGDVFYLESHKKIYLAKKIAYNAEALSGGDTAYFIYKQGVFAINPETNEANQIFFSNNVNPRRIVTTKGAVYVVGKTSGGGETGYAWKLNNEEDTQFGTRPIDILPSFGSSLGYGDVDLVGDIANIEIPVGRDSSFSYLERRKSDTLDNLKQSGLDISKLKINTP